MLLFVILSFGCTHKPTSESKNTSKIRVDSLYGTVIADSIIYDVIIHNPDPENPSTTEYLKDLRQKALIDSLFDLVYAEKITAYDFFSNEILSVRDLKKMESETGYSREDIGKIQFTERWFFDKTSQQFKKEVMSLVLGYELLNQDGGLRGYKPVFKIYLKH
jgi:Gliding motility associated protein GldN